MIQDGTFFNMLKYCSSCNNNLPIENFSRDKNRKDNKYPYCYSCSREKNRANYWKYKDKRDKQNRKYYQNNSEVRKKVKERVERKKQINKLKLLQYLELHPCIDCGESDPIVLEFDHIRDKYIEISKMITNNYNWEKIEKEISKCEVRCANCHKRKTHKGCYKDKLCYPSSDQALSIHIKL